MVVILDPEHIQMKILSVFSFMPFTLFSCSNKSKGMTLQVICQQSLCIFLKGPLQFPDTDCFPTLSRLNLQWKVIILQPSLQNLLLTVSQEMRIVLVPVKPDLHLDEAFSRSKITRGLQVPQIWVGIVHLHSDSVHFDKCLNNRELEVYFFWVL